MENWKKITQKFKEDYFDKDDCVFVEDCWSMIPFLEQELPKVVCVAGSSLAESTFNAEMV